MRKFRIMRKHSGPGWFLYVPALGSCLLVSTFAGAIELMDTYVREFRPVLR